MGVSTDAILFFGYVWDDEFDLPEEVWDTFCGNADEYPVQVGRHGSDSWECPFIFIAETEVEAGRGYPKQVPIRNLAKQTTEKEMQWEAMLDEFCAKYDITPPGACGWRLVSWWG